MSNKNTRRGTLAEIPRTFDQNSKSICRTTNPFEKSNDVDGELLTLCFGLSSKLGGGRPKIVNLFQNVTDKRVTKIALRHVYNSMLDFVNRHYAVAEKPLLYAR